MPSVISLFAGCGGSSRGYRDAGFRCVLAAEWDKGAAGCYRVNFPGVPVWEGDVCELSAGEAIRLSGIPIGELDLLDGSPPCQGFSTSGERDLVDPRNQLFREFVRLLRGLRPRCMVMENVEGMATGKMRSLCLAALREMRESGYRVSCRVLNAWWYGVPQDRKRTIFVGMREDLEMAPPHPPRERITPISVQDALGRPWAMRNTEFANRWRSPRLPAPTLIRTAPPEMVLCLPGEGNDVVIAKGAVPRRATVEEAKVLQGFPEGMWVDSYGRIGNSVPPPLSRAVGKRLLSALGEK